MTRARDVANIDGLLTTTGDTYYASAAGTPARLGVGTTGQVMTVASGVPSWATPSSGTPAFVGAIAWSNTSQALTSGVATVLTFGSEEVDTDGFHSTSSNTGRMTIPSGKDGKYLLTVHARLWNASSFTQIYFYKNGSAISNGIEGGQVWALGTGYIRTTASVVATAVAGDYFEVLGGADGSPTKENARFSIQFLGA
jgi:hypothetical protein